MTECLLNDNGKDIAMCYELNNSERYDRRNQERNCFKQR